MNKSNVHISTQLQTQLDEIVQKLAQRRKDSGMKLLDMEKDLEVDRRKLSEFEKGKFNIGIADMYCSMFGFTFLTWVTRS